MEEPTAQLRAKKGVISQYGEGVFFVPPTRARFLLETGQFILVNAGPAVGPEEIKPAGSQEKKTESLAEGTDGPLTDSAESIQLGPDVPLSVSVGDQVSPSSNAEPLKKRRGRPPKSKPLP